MGKRAGLGDNISICITFEFRRFDVEMHTNCIIPTIETVVYVRLCSFFEDLERLEVHFEELDWLLLILVEMDKKWMSLMK